MARVAAASLIAGVASCSGEREEPTTPAYGTPATFLVDAGADASSDAGAPARVALPPIPPHPPPSAGSVGTHTHAVTRFLFEPDPALAFQHAYSVDGLKFSDPNDPRHCNPPAGQTKANVVVDGPNGEDNSFGRNVLPILYGLDPDLQMANDAAIHEGSQTWLIRVAGLGVGDGYPLGAQVFPAKGQRDPNGVPVAPTTWFDYEWQPIAKYLSDSVGSGAELRSKFVLPDSYVVDDLWVSGPKTMIPLRLVILGMPAQLLVRNAVVTHRYSADRRLASGGIVSGVVNAREITGILERWMAKATPSLCGDKTLGYVATQILGASDITLDGTQQPGACNAISIGLGYTAEEAKIGVAAPDDAPDEGCAK